MCQMSIHQNIKCIKYKQIYKILTSGIQIFTVTHKNSSEKIHIHYFLAQFIVHHPLQSTVVDQEDIIVYLDI